MNFESTVQTYLTLNIHNRHFKVLENIDIYYQPSTSMDNASRDSAYCGLKNPQRKKFALLLVCIALLVLRWWHLGCICINFSL